jgi:hypothetical protein
MATAGNIDVVVAQAVSRRFPPRRSGFEPWSEHVGFVLDKAALGQVFSEHFVFHLQTFHRLLHTHHPSLSGAGTVGQ